MPVHCSFTPSIKISGTHLCIWVERGTVGVKCLAQKHNIMCPARAQTQSPLYRVKHTNHEVMVPPNKNYRLGSNIQYLSHLSKIQQSYLLLWYENVHDQILNH